jgi:hypothetical protein
LALKRAIVQRSLQQQAESSSGSSAAVSGDGQHALVRTKSASSSRGDLLSEMTDKAPSNVDLPDAISDLEAQLSKLKSEASNRPRSSQPHHEKDSSEVVSHNKEEPKSKPKRKEEHRKSRRESRKESKEKLARPDVPLLPLDNTTKRENIEEEEEVRTSDCEEEEEIVEERSQLKKKKTKKKQPKKSSRDSEQRAKEDEALAKSIDKLMANVSSEIETNQNILGSDKKVVSSRVAGGLHAPLNSARLKELRRNEDRKKRAEARDKIDSLLNNEKLEFKIPRWKHELNGNMNPKPELVLKGRGLFRMVARLVLYFYAKPIVRVRIMRIMGRDMLKEELTKATLLSLDTCASWLTHAVKVPLASIVQVRFGC